MKRAPLPTKSRYQPDRNEVDFMSRRLLPLLRDQPERYPLGHLLMEAYMQGIRDTQDALSRQGKAP